MEAAIKNHEEVKAAFLKLDEARFVLNRIMGPGGTMAENERKMYLGSNLAEHDRLVRNSKDRGNNQLTASANINPIHSVQGPTALNPSKAYFGQAGIAGNSNIGLPSPSQNQGKAGAVQNY